MNYLNYYFYEGTHLYINIKNIEKLIQEDEKDEDMSHIFRMLNVFVYSLEDFIITKYKDKVFFEKLTGGRIHLYTKSNENIGSVLLDICRYSYCLAKEIVHFMQFQKIPSIILQFGADSGPFTESYIGEDGYEELTTIGACANFACKLQIKSLNNEILISESTYNLLSKNEQEAFNLVDMNRLKDINKHKQGKIVYSCSACDYNYLQYFVDASYGSFIEKARTYSNSHPLKDVVTDKKGKINEDAITINKNLRINEIVCFVDVRNFTKQFSGKDLNVSMKEKTIELLSTMYRNCLANGGTHIQFQGDREFSVFSISDVDNAVIYALKVSKEIKNNLNLSVGIGLNDGITYFGKVGKDSRFSNVKKQWVLVGKTVNIANTYEDECAEENEIVISPSIYHQLKDSLKELFIYRKSYYVTNKNYDDFLKKEQKKILDENHTSNYRKPWSSL